MAGVLIDSFRHHHPASSFSLLIIDGHLGVDIPSGVEVLSLEDLGIEPVTLDRMKTIYSVMELATAVKPALLRTLLARGEVVCYLDPDIQVYAPFDDIVDVAATSDIVLTPHVLRPIPRDGREVAERSIMLSGIFNLGFIAVGQGAAPFLDWWHERLLVDAISDVTHGLFTDQRWVDWAPALFRHAVCREEGMNVAYWNIHERHAEWHDSGVLINGSPLRCFHFSGYDPAKPTELSRHTGGSARCALEDNAAVAELAARYSVELSSRGHERLLQRPYEWAVTADGLPLPPFLRRVYRDELLAAVSRGMSMADAGDGPPSPFDPTQASDFREWVCEPVRGTARSPISRCEAAVWTNRPDLQRAFPDIDDRDADAFRKWLDVDPGAASTLAGLPKPLPSGDDDVADDWNVLGYFRAELGVGEAGRLVANALEAAGLGVHRVSLDAPGSRARYRPVRSLSGFPRARHTVSSVNADQTRAALARHGLLDSRPGRCVGLWFWEVDRLPQRMVEAFDHLDEVWTASNYTRDILQQYTHKPVRTIPLPVSAPTAPTRHTWATLGIPVHGKVFVCIHDFHSVPRRKNAVGVIEAYLRATTPSDRTSLLVKSINGAQHPAALAELRRTAAERPDVVIVDGYVSSGAMRAIVQLADCLVSLHRSEGFGLNLAHAMLLGTPIIATAFSGNMDFMNDDTALLVPYRLVDVGTGADPYPPDARWAEPDLDAAARCIRRVVDAPGDAAAIAVRAALHASDRFDIARSVDFVRRYASSVDGHPMVGSRG